MKTSIQTFIEKSKQGGFDPKGLSDTEMLLEPKCFEAVGRVEGWDGTSTTFTKSGEEGYKWWWKRKMHGLVDARIAGKSCEVYLKEILN